MIKKTPLNKISKKRKERLAWVSEKDIFKEIRLEREHSCQLCGKYIYEPQAWCFSHMLAKWMFPKRRLDKNNILLVESLECHHKVDQLVIWNKRYIEDCLEKGNGIDIKSLII
jgi:hypothetical protein